MPPVIDKKKCVLCGYCAEICPTDCLKLMPTELLVRYPDECWHCRACVKDCPKNAITLRYPISHMLLTMEPQNMKEEG